MRTRLAAAVTVTAMLCLLTGCHLVKADQRVAFLGDSITQGWHYPRANFGVRGNTTAQMIARFPTVIPGHNFREVVILGGTNDVLLDVNPDQTIHNLETLAEETEAQHAEPILCEIPPIFHSFKPGDTKNYSPTVIELNRRIVKLAQAHGWKLVDYYTPLVDHPGYSADGVHMKRRGYLVMESVLLPQLLRS